MNLIDRVVDLLSNGRGHSIKRLEEKVDPEGTKLGYILSFLGDYGFIEKEGEQVRLAGDMLRFIQDDRETEIEDTSIKR